MSTKADEGQLNEVLEEIRGAAQDNAGPKVSVGDMIDALDERGYGPALAVIPLIELTPIGGIPGFPTLLAMIIAILAIRLLLGYEHFWAPDWLRRRRLKSSSVEKSLDWLRPLASRIDAGLHERLRPFVGDTGQRVACLVILILLLTVPPLEFIPFATSGPMIVIAIFGLAILFRDGLLMLFAFLGSGAVLIGAAGFGFSQFS